MKRLPPANTIVVKALCIFHKDGKVLAGKGYDDVKNEIFYRLLGGGVDFFEKSEAGMRREIGEELQSEIENLKLVDVLDSLFVYRGHQGHQIVFLYSGDLSRKELYEQNPIHIVEETYDFDAEWVPVKDILEGKAIMYPQFDYANLFKQL